MVVFRSALTNNKNVDRCPVCRVVALKKQRGEYTGGRPPYGWRLGADKSTLEPYPPEQQVIADAHNARDDGMSYREVAVHLDRLGHRTRDGGFFSVSSVHRLIARAA